MMVTIWSEEERVYGRVVHCPVIRVEPDVQDLTISRALRGLCFILGAAMDSLTPDSRVAVSHMPRRAAIRIVD